MRKKLFIFISLISISFLLTACTNKRQEEESSIREQTNSEESLKGSLFDLLKLGKNVKCTFGSNDESGISEGTTYVSGGKARSDFYVTTTEGDKFDSHSISDSDWVYMWTSENEVGTKVSLSSLPKNDETEKISNNQSYNKFSEAYDYKCTPWIVDESKFNIPTNIQFIDYTEMLNTLQNKTEDLKENLKSMCGSCDLIGDTQKVSECKQNLGCN